MARPRVFLSVPLMIGTALTAPLCAQEAGHVKVARGTVQVERAGQKAPAAVGSAVQAGDGHRSVRCVQHLFVGAACHCDGARLAVRVRQEDHEGLLRRWRGWCGAGRRRLRAGGGERQHEASHRGGPHAAATRAPRSVSRRHG